MKRYLTVLFAILSCTLGAQQPSVPEIPFESVPNLLKLPPDLYLGEVPAVAVNSKGHVFVYSRTGSPSGSLEKMRAAQLFEFAADGKFIREIGKNLFSMGWAHGVRVDKEDNIWIVDNGTNMVTKFDPEGRVLFALGRRQESVQGPLPRDAPAVQWRFNEPTDVAFDSAGNIYVSDGYVNSRVAKFDKNGLWVKAWGEKGKGPGQFNTPHNIVVDDKDIVYVADRSNNRIQVFDTDGKFLRQITQNVPPAPGTIPPNIYGYGQKPDGTWESLWPMAICITPGPNQVLYVSDYVPGRIFKIALDGKILGVFGRPGMTPGLLGQVHGLACPKDNEVYTGENRGWRVQKFILHPNSQKSE